MSNCQITLKIKDFFPKIDSLVYNNYKCLISNGNNTSEIYLSNYKNELFNHLPKIINSDLFYKIKLIDCVNNSLIGGSELIVPYDIISQISLVNPIIYNDHLKLIIDQKTKRKIFGSLLPKKTIILSIIIEIKLITENINNNKKIKILKKNKSIEDIKYMNKFIKKENIRNNILDKFKSLNKFNNTNPRNNYLNYVNTYMIKKKKKNKYLSEEKNNLSLTNLNYDNKRKILINNILKNNKREGKSEKISKEKKPMKFATSFFDDNDFQTIKRIHKYNREKYLNIDKNYLINNNKKNNNNSKIMTLNNNKKIIIIDIIDNHNNNKKLILSDIKNDENKKKNIIEKRIHRKKNIKNSIKSKSLKSMRIININKDLNIKNKNHRKFNLSHSSIILNGIKNNKFFLNEQNIYIKEKTPKNYQNRNNLFSKSLNYSSFNYGSMIKNNSFNTIENNYIIKINKSNKNFFKSNMTKLIKVNKKQSKNNLNILEIEDNEIELINFQLKSHSILLKQLLILYNKNKDLIKKNIIYKEKLLNLKKEKNLFDRKKISKDSKNFIYLTNSKLNSKLLFNLIGLKKLENNIYQKIFNQNYNIFNNNFMLKKKETQNNIFIQNDNISLLLKLIRNCIKNFGKISLIYGNDKIKNIELIKLFLKYGINEDEYYIKNIYSRINNNINIFDINEKKLKYLSTFNKSEIKIIKEEDGEDDDNDSDASIELFNKDKDINLIQSKKNNNIKKDKKIPSILKVKYNNRNKEQKKFKSDFFNLNRNHIIFNNIFINNINEKK